jgi:hypothetical protein
MAKRHGKEGVVKIGANTMKTTKWTLEESVDVADSTAQGDTAKSHLVGIPGWSGSADAWMDKTEATGQGALTIGASVTLNLYDDGVGAGQTYHSGTATVTRISRNVDIGSTISVSFAFEGNGALTHPTVSA